MRLPRKEDPGNRWLTTLSWPDKVIARCFPGFFERYAPDEIKEQWARYLAKKHPGGQGSGGEGDVDAKAGTKDGADDRDE